MNTIKGHIFRTRLAFSDSIFSEFKLHYRSEFLMHKKYNLFWIQKNAKIYILLNACRITTYFLIIFIPFSHNGSLAMKSRYIFKLFPNFYADDNNMKWKMNNKATNTQPCVEHEFKLVIWSAVSALHSTNVQFPTLFINVYTAEFDGTSSVLFTYRYFSFSFV